MSETLPKNELIDSDVEAVNALSRKVKGILERKLRSAEEVEGAVREVLDREKVPHGKVLVMKDNRRDDDQEGLYLVIVEVPQSWPRDIGMTGERSIHFRVGEMPYEPESSSD